MKQSISFEFNELLSCEEGIELLVKSKDTRFLLIRQIFPENNEFDENIEDKERFSEPIRDCMNLGILSIEDFETKRPEIPLGYENPQESAFCYLDTLISLENTSDSRELVVDAVHICMNDTNPIFSTHIVDNVEYPINGTIIHPNSNLNVVLRMKIPESFKGDFNKWIVLQFSARISKTAISAVVESFITGFMITGEISQSDSGSNLSSDAKTFIPKAALEYFDSFVIIFILKYNLY